MSNVVSMASAIRKIPHPHVGAVGGKQVTIHDASGATIAETRVVLRNNKLPQAEEAWLKQVIAECNALTARFYDRGKQIVIGDQPQKKN